LLNRGNDHFFNGPALFIRDLSQQSHHPLIERVHGQVCNMKDFDVVRPSFGNWFHKFGILAKKTALRGRTNNAVPLLAGPPRDLARGGGVAPRRIGFGMLAPYVTNIRAKSWMG